MANTTPTIYMNLPNPNPGVDPGPDWADNLYSCNVIIDQHNHSPGSGQQINPSGMNINSDLSFAGNNATLLRSVRFQSQGSPIPGTAPDLGILYESGIDLFYNDGTGNQIRITQSGSVAGSAGTITGLPSGTASASYSSGTGTFVFQQATATAANMDVGTVIIRYPGSYPSPSGNFIALEAPSSLSSGYAITLPTTTPAVANALLTSNTSGDLSYTNADETTIHISAGIISVIVDSIVPAGVMRIWAGPISNIPSGHLLCDGSAVSRTTYAALFSAIGTAWGIGDGSTTFNLPITSGLFLRGQDNGSGNDPDAASRSDASGAFNGGAGGNTGDAVGSYETDQVIEHFHNFSYGNNTSGGSNDSSYLSVFNNTELRSVTGLDSIAHHSVDANSSGDTAGNGSDQGGAESRPANVYVNYIIKF